MTYFGQFDTQRLAQLGKDGCYTPSGFVTDTRMTSKVILKPMSEILAKKENINALTNGLSSKAKQIRELSSRCQGNYQKYLDTQIPVCGAGVVGWLKKAVGTDGYQECLSAVDKSREPVMLANTQFAEVGNRIRDLSSDYSELMQYSPGILDWQKLCQSKLDLDSSHRQLKEANTKLAEAALKKMQSEATIQEKADNEFNRFEAFLQNFLAALEALIRMVLEVFDSFLRGLTKVSAFISDHPAVLWVGGGVVGLGILAFVLRPYISILNKFVSK